MMNSRDSSAQAERLTEDGTNYSAPIGQEQIIYDTKHMLFSVLHARDMGMVMRWKPWKTRIIKIFTVNNVGRLMYAYPDKPQYVPKHHCFQLDSRMNIELVHNKEVVQGVSESVLTVKCWRLDGIESCFRIIGPESDIEEVLMALNTSIGNTEDLLHTHRVTAITVRSTKGTFNMIFNSTKGGKSAMRRAVNRALADHDERNRKQQILSRRGAFNWLPVAFANDLTHGSWWFVLGSAGILITSAIVIYNKYRGILDEDDSSMPQRDFVASWALMAISGLFSLLASLAFARAFHNDPPMKAIFSGFYHFQSDELLGSWLFVGATIPFVPYCLIFVSETYYRNLLYLVALACAMLATAGSLLFVRACYPSDKEHRDILLPMIRALSCLCPCCCRCSEATLQHYFANDWLGGTWLFYWACLFATFASGIIFIATLVIQQTLLIFIFGTSLLESVFFLIGCAYFVAGSYAEHDESTVMEAPAHSDKQNMTNPLQANKKGSANDDSSDEEEGGGGSVSLPPVSSLTMNDFNPSTSTVR